MLILTTKPGEVIYIGDQIRVTVVEIKGNQIRLGIDAPPDFRIFRKEIYDQIQEENQAAAAGALEGLSEALLSKRGGGEEQQTSGSAFGKLSTTKVQSPAPQVVKRKKRERTQDE